MVKKVIGWCLFVIGILYFLGNIAWVGLGAAGVIRGYSPDWEALPFQLILWIFLTVLMVWGGWSLAHPKSKEEIAKKKKEKEEGVV